MNKLLISAFILTLVSVLAVPPVMSSDTTPERGARALNELSALPVARQMLPDRDSIERDFVQQPPLIPHDIDGYQVNLNFNKCMSCHSWTNYKEARATKVSASHFKDREGNDLANISPRRYFCMQCHVPQMDAPPLVENTFTPAGGLGRR